MMVPAETTFGVAGLFWPVRADKNSNGPTQSDVRAVV